MESELKQVSGSVFALIGPHGATNFTVIKNRAGRAILIDADIGASTRSKRLYNSRAVPELNISLIRTNISITRRRIFILPGAGSRSLPVPAASAPCASKADPTSSA